MQKTSFRGSTLAEAPRVQAKNDCGYWQAWYARDMNDDYMPRSLFVDFMYAVVVGATIVRIDASHLDIRSFEFWGVWFLIAVFMEDLYLYHKEVVPNLSSVMTARQLAIEMSIVLLWYVAQVAYPTKLNWFLVCIALFFALKLSASFAMAGSYPKQHDWFFLIPITTAGVLLCHHASLAVVFCSLVPAWTVAVAAWWWKAPSRMGTSRS